MLHGVLEQVHSAGALLVQDFLGRLNYFNYNSIIKLRYLITSNPLYINEYFVNFIALKKNKITPGYVGHNLIINKGRFAGAKKTKVVFLKKARKGMLWLLPSGEKKKINNFTSIEKGNSNYLKVNKKIVKVRGLAKNAVDHPNGGSSRHSFSKTPWGLKAKKGK